MPSEVCSTSSWRTAKRPSSTTKRPFEGLSRAYRQASTFFITRRLREALSVLEPLLFPGRSRHDHEPGNGSTDSGPLVNAPRKLHIKLWNLYIAVLDATLGLGPDNGKQTVGETQWRNLTHKIRNGEIWGDVVRHGYDGDEKSVDADVVANLSVLLLSHAPSQAENQRRLERYLSALTPWPPDTKADKGQEDMLDGVTEAADDNPLTDHHPTKTSGSLLPMSLMEIYTLHVLPRNNDWTRARSFIAAATSLDDANRHRLLQLLEALEAEQKNAVTVGEGRTPGKGASQDRRPRSDDQPNGKLRDTPNGDLEMDNGTLVGVGKEDESSLVNGAIPSNTRSRTSTSKAKESTSRTKGPRALRTGEKSALIARGQTPAINVMSRLQQFFTLFVAFLKINPLMYLRTLLFLIGLLFALSRGEYRERIRKMTATGWNKLKIGRAHV